MRTSYEYKLPDLPYAYDALEPLYSREQVELHHDEHHAAYVAGANRAIADLTQARESGEYGALNQLEKDLAFHISGHVLHSIFWRNLSPDGGGEPEGPFANEIGRAFGDADRLRAQLGCAAVNVQGSGWGALCYEPLSGRLLVEQIRDHHGNISNGTIPLLVLDMWEHAYYLQFRNDRAAWVENLWELVDWNDVADRYERAKRLELGLAA